MHKNSKTVLSFPKFHNEKDFLIWKAENSKAIFLKAAHQAATQVMEAVDARKWTEKYPFQSTGIAAVAGFLVTKPFDSQAIDKSPKLQTSENIQATNPFMQTLFSTVLSIGVDVLKEVLPPLLKEHFQSEIQRS